MSMQACSRALLASFLAICCGDHKKDAQGFEGELRHWDVGFWAERLREAKYSISDEQLRPYFSLPNVLNGLFQV